MTKTKVTPGRTPGHGDEIVAEHNHHEGAGRDLPYLDAAKREFHCSNGQVWKLSDREVNPMVVMQIGSRGRPEVPKVEVTLLGRHKQVQENPNDPDYKARLAAWQQEANSRIAQYVLCVGINAGNIPDDFVGEYLDFVPDARENEIKFAYITSNTPLDDIPELMEAIMGETEPTAAGMDAVAESFRDDG